MLRFKVAIIISSVYQGIDILKFALVLALDSPWFYVSKYWSLQQNNHRLRACFNDIGVSSSFLSSLMGMKLRT